MHVVRGPEAARPDPDPPPTTVVLDLGGVLVRWDPRLVFAQVLGPDDDVEAFLDEIGFAEWNHEQDAGRPWADAVAELSARHPHRAEAIAAYPAMFAASVPGLLDDTVAIVEELHQAGVRLLALTNWSAELFPTVRHRLTFLDRFDGVVVSGEERVAKPDPAIFRVLVERYGVVPEQTVYVDDLPLNVEAAETLGFRGHVFTTADDLRARLERDGLLPPSS